MAATLRALRCSYGGRLMIFDGGTSIRPLGEAIAAEAPCSMSEPIGRAHFLTISAACPSSSRCSVSQPLHEDLVRAPDLAAEHARRRPFADVGPVLPIRRIFPRQCRVPATSKGRRDAGPTPGIVIHTIPLNHPTGRPAIASGMAGGRPAISPIWAYGQGARSGARRLPMQGRRLDQRLAGAEYEAGAASGHSTWRAGLKLAAAGSIPGSTCRSHHDPSHNDAAMAGSRPRRRRGSGAGVPLRCGARGHDDPARRAWCSQAESPLP